MMPWEVRSATQKSWRGLGSKAKQRDEVIARNASKMNAWFAVAIFTTLVWKISEEMMSSGMEDLGYGVHGFIYTPDVKDFFFFLFIYLFTFFGKIVATCILINETSREKTFWLKHVITNGYDDCIRFLTVLNMTSYH